MNPFIRPVDGPRLAPVGWTAEPGGLWGGREVEVVYDPSRHQVIRATFDIGVSTRIALTGAGFHCVARAENNELWARDTGDTRERARQALDRSEVRRTAAPHLGIVR